MAKPKLSKTEKFLQANVESIIKKEIDGVQLSIFDLSKVSDAGMKAGREAFAGGLHYNNLVDCFMVSDAIHQAVRDIVAQLRKN